MPTLEPGRVLLRSASAAEWSSRNPILGTGELGLELQTDGSTAKLKLGDGSTQWADLPYFTGPVGPEGQPGPAGQDGALSLALADASLVNTGTTTNPVLKVGDLSGTYASAAALAGLAAQQGQLMGVAATRDELNVSHMFQGLWNNSGTWVQTDPGAHIRTFWVAPYACQVTAAQLINEFSTIAQSASNFAIFQLFRVRAGTTTLIVQKSTADEAMAPRTAWSFAGATWDTAAATLQAGDGIALAVGTVTGVTLKLPYTITCTVQPT